MKKIITFMGLALLSATLTTCTPQTQQTVTNSLTSQEDSISTIPGTNAPVTNSEGAIPDGSQGKYLTYSNSAFATAKENRRVLFFHASWCPTCKIAHNEFSTSISDIPSDVVIFKTDYDSETELKKKYGITYQHTFVLVDEDGNELKKWNGGGINELTSNLL